MFVIQADCCSCTALAEKRHQQAATVQAKVLVDKAIKQRCHEVAAREKTMAGKANKGQRQESAKCAGALAESISSAEQCCPSFVAPLKMATNLAIEKALAELAKVCGIMGCNVGRVGGSRQG